MFDKEKLWKIYEKYPPDTFRTIMYQAMRKHKINKYDTFLELFSGENIPILDRLYTSDMGDRIFTIPKKKYEDFGVYKYGDTPVYCQTLIDFSVRTGQVDLLQFMIEHGGEMTGQTMSQMIHSNNFDVKKMIIENAPVGLLESKSVVTILLFDNQFQLLYYFILRGVKFGNIFSPDDILKFSDDQIVYLLENGVDIDGVNYILSYAEPEDTVEILEKYGAIVTFEDLSIDDFQELDLDDEELAIFEGYNFTNSTIFTDPWDIGIYSYENDKFTLIGSMDGYEITPSITKDALAIAKRAGFAISDSSKYHSESESESESDSVNDVFTKR